MWMFACVTTKDNYKTTIVIKILFKYHGLFPKNTFLTYIRLKTGIHFNQPKPKISCTLLIETFIT